jgi:hypothetical protein
MPMLAVDIPEGALSPNAKRDCWLTQPPRFRNQGTEISRGYVGVE